MLWLRSQKWQKSSRPIESSGWSVLQHLMPHFVVSASYPVRWSWTWTSPSNKPITFSEPVFGRQRFADQAPTVIRPSTKKSTNIILSWLGTLQPMAIVCSCTTHFSGEASFRAHLRTPWAEQCVFFLPMMLISIQMTQVWTRRATTFMNIIMRRWRSTGHE